MCEIDQITSYRGLGVNETKGKFESRSETLNASWPKKVTRRLHRVEIECAVRFSVLCKKSDLKLKVCMVCMDRST